ncbi:unnamed protein product [Heterosigma akashiwo]
MGPRSLLAWCQILIIGFALFAPNAAFLQTQNQVSRSVRSFTVTNARSKEEDTKVNDKLDKFSRFITSGDKPTVIDFYAKWCGPCQLLAPELEIVAQKMRDTVRVAKIDTDANPSVASKYKIQGLPTIVFFDKNGEEKGRVEGFYRSSQLIPQIEYYLGGPDN